MSRYIPLRLSAAKRWMACPGSIRMAKLVNADEGRSSRHADRGTVAHALLEIALRLDLDVEELLPWTGKTLNGVPPVPVDENMVQSVSHALIYTRSYLAKNPGTDFHPETKVSLSAYFQNCIVEGTSDLILDNHPHELVALDYKNGVEEVIVQDNEQVMGYALGYAVRSSRRYKSVRLVVVQPNAPGRPPVTMHRIRWSNLVAFGEQMKRAVSEVHKPNAPLRAGAHCRWCPASGICREYGNRALEIARSEFKELPE